MHSKSFREKAILPKKAARFCELLKESNRLMLCLLEPCEIVTGNQRSTSFDEIGRNEIG